MEQYYAILVRDVKFNDKLIDEDDFLNLTLDEVDQLATRIISTNKSYQEIYNEFKELKNSFNHAEDAKNLEMCIVRISVMKNWELLNQNLAK